MAEVCLCTVIVTENWHFCSSPFLVNLEVNRCSKKWAIQVLIFYSHQSLQIKSWFDGNEYQPPYWLNWWLLILDLQNISTFNRLNRLNGFWFYKTFQPSIGKIHWIFWCRHFGNQTKKMLSIWCLILVTVFGWFCFLDKVK